MACENANDFDYRLVNDETGLKDAISELKGKIAERNTLLAVDCEGDSLSRKGALTIITVATEEKVFMFNTCAEIRITRIQQQCMDLANFLKTNLVRTMR